MDALANLEQIEYVINNASKSFSGSTIKVDGEELIQLVEQLRLAMTEELRQAEKIIQEKNNIIGEAGREAEAIREEVENNISTMIDESEIMKKAQTRADQMLTEAQDQAVKITDKARIYADEVLESLDKHLRLTLDNVAQGRAQLSVVGREPKEPAADPEA